MRRQSGEAYLRFVEALLSPSGEHGAQVPSRREAGSRAGVKGTSGVAKLLEDGPGMVGVIAPW